MALSTLLAAFTVPTPPTWALDLCAEGLAGFVLFRSNVDEPSQVARLTAALRAARADVLIAIDEEGGDVTRLAHATGSPYPGNAALGAVDDPVRTRDIYRAIGMDLARLGINFNLAPVADVNTTDDNPIIGPRSFGADPARVAAHTAAAVTGLHDAGVAACAKHFPGHGATIVDSHVELPTVDVPLEVLRRRELPPFAAAIEAGTRAIMTAHVRVPALTGADPATFSRAALVELLRAEYGFTGAVMTDALEMAGAAAAAGGTSVAAVRALAAGADLLCIGARVRAALVGELIDEIIAGVRDGRLDADRLEQAAERTAALAASAVPPTLAASAVPPAPGPSGAPPPLATSGAPPAIAASGAPPIFAGGSGRAGTPVDAGLAYEVARQAVLIEGSLAVLDLHPPLVVRLAAAWTVVEGQVPWGLGPYLTEAEEVSVAAGDVSVPQLRARAGERAIVLVGRHLHRFPATRALTEELAAAHPTVVVEMGWPAAWRPPGARAFVLTYGASSVLARAVTAALGLS